MSSKSVDINPNPRGKQTGDSTALDSFVQGTKPVPTKEPIKRLTFEIPASLHKRIRRICLERDEDMAVALRRILVKHFPEQE